MKLNFAPICQPNMIGVVFRHAASAARPRARRSDSPDCYRRKRTGRSSRRRRSPWWRRGDFGRGHALPVLAVFLGRGGSVLPPPQVRLKVCLYCCANPSGLMSPSQTIEVVTNGFGIRPAVSRDIAEAAVAEIGLADERAVARLAERPGVVAESHIGRAVARAGLEAQAEEPVVHQDAAQAEAETVTLAIALLGVIGIGDQRARADRCCHCGSS